MKHTHVDAVAMKINERIFEQNIDVLKVPRETLQRTERVKTPLKLN